MLGKNADVHFWTTPNVAIVAVFMTAEEAKCCTEHFWELEL